MTKSGDGMLERKCFICSYLYICKWSDNRSGTKEHSRFVKQQSYNPM